ncbi:hypothetical protein LguiA_012796 [Lonicera macranthoides]
MEEKSRFGDYEDRIGVKIVIKPQKRLKFTIMLRTYGRALVRSSAMLFKALMRLPKLPAMGGGGVSQCSRLRLCLGFISFYNFLVRPKANSHSSLVKTASEVGRIITVAKPPSHITHCIAAALEFVNILIVRRNGGLDLIEVGRFVPPLNGAWQADLRE